MLQTRTPSCFSREYVLLDNGRPCGRFKGRTWSSNIDVSLLGRYRLTFEHHGWFNGWYKLTDKQTGTVLATGKNPSIFTTKWDLELSVGSCVLAAKNWRFHRGFTVTQGDHQLAEVGLVRSCDGSWSVNPSVDLPLTDQVMIGMVFQTILRRRRQNAAAAG